VLAILPQLNPSTVIGVVKPLLALHREGATVFDVAFESWVSGRRLARADVVVFCRNTEPRYGAALGAALAMSKPIIYELDDDFFSIAPNTPVGRYHRDPARLAQLEHYLRHASLVRVYSEALRARVAPFNARVERVAGLVDWDLVPAVRPSRPPGPVRIVYATSRIADSLSEMFVPDLCRVLNHFPGRVEAWFLGHRPQRLADRGDVHFVPFVHDYDRFFRRFASAGFDIGLAPLADDAFHRAKTDNKFREYAASRIAGIFSDVKVYRDCVVPERTGLLVPAVPGAWAHAMTRLIEDGELRARMQEQAYADARTRYSMEQSKDAWRAQLAETLTRGAPARGPVPIGTRLSARSRTLQVLKRTAEVLCFHAVPAAMSMAARIRWHVTAARTLRRLRRELARSRPRLV